MAKQIFSTGQVLTAAQMTSLQQTAMLGGAANAKTASYVLVAADAGDSITMSSASATTITVNTGLFSAGDIVTIINLGVGVSTITAGSATVSTSGSLALAQNQGGVLRFTSASAAIFFQFTAGGGGMTLLNSGGTSLSGAATTISFTSTGYVNLQVQVLGVKTAADANGYTVRINGDTAANYSTMRSNIYDTGPTFDPNNSIGATNISIRSPLGTSSDYYKLGQMVMDIYSPNDTSQHFFNWSCVGSNTTLTNPWYMFNSLGIYDAAAAISSLTFTTVSSTFTAGTVYVYGVK